ncbi:MAG TPA: pyruvate kinase [Candidatus Saccharimonadales bacterium]|nr:pyruvate kinase [Candidatus Saccharimonadales bacterium]
MHLTDMAPKVPLKSFKRTKIVATLGPATDSYEKIEELIDSGANVIRLNFSHGTHEERLVQIPWIRKASEKLGKPVAILQDLQGPKVRLGDFDGIINVHTGEELSFEYKCNYEETGRIPTQYDLSDKVKVGERLFLFDGKVRTTVTGIEGNVVKANVENDGILLKRKGMNLPDTDFKGDILTEKDMADIKFGATQDIDYVALSFVQTADDINNLRQILADLKSEAKLISKIETLAGVANIESIVEASDAVMVARGDLAVETPSESVPVVQRQIIGLCLKHAKPSIVATQMLMSMVDMPEPTRAEVSDVATAVFLGADAVMLSDETANGKYPIEAVKTMKRVALYAEQHPPMKTVYPFEREHTIQNAISGSIMTMARNIDATAIVAETKTGSTALQIASRRPETAVIAVTSELRTAQQLALVNGIKSYVRPADPEAASKLTDWLLENKVLKSGDVVVSVSGRYPGVAGATDTIKVRVLE